MSFSPFRRSAVASASAARAFSTSSPRSLARISVIGNLADTPEVHSTSTGREVVRYAVASHSGPRDNRKTSWFRVSSFADGPRRDFLMNLPKGTHVYIEGDISTTAYHDSQGVQRTGINITQRALEVLRRPQHVDHGEQIEQSEAEQTQSQ